MFKNNLKIAWRHLIKDRQFTLLNIVGLSAGLACTLLIWFWVSDEMSYDKFFDKDDQVYQVMELRNFGGEYRPSDESSGLLNEVIKTKMPEVEYAAAVAPPDWWQKFTLSVDDKNIKATGQYVGKDYFNIFSFKMLEGKPADVLQSKTSIVISDELARKLFNTTENVIGKSIKLQHDSTFFVTGIFEKPPIHSSQQFDFVLSFEYLKNIQNWVVTWNNTGPHNFIMVKKGTDMKAFNKRIANIIRESTNDTSRLARADRFSDNYLLHTFDHGSIIGSKMENVKLFSIIAIFILVIACINFMNLSTAAASRRMKEVGVKKVVGAGRKQLISQFLLESMLLTIVAVIFAIALAWSLLPQFNAITGKQIAMHMDSSFIIRIVIITVITGLLAGSYPALYLSGFSPIKILKGKFQSSMAEVFSRKGLVVFQFTLSVILIISVMVVYRQVHFIQQTNPGYSKDNIIRFNTEGNVLNNEESFITRLKSIPGVVNASFTFNNMVGRNFGNNGIDWDGKPANQYVYFEGFGAGYDFIETMGMQMAMGRPYSKNFGDDDTKIILNETAVKMMNLKNPVGTTIRLFEKPRQIIGVIKDFHFESLHEVVKPAYMTITGGNNTWNKMVVRIKADNQRQTIEAIQQLYATVNPGFPFDFNFLDEAYQKQYESESRVEILSRYFAGLAILISCLGLFGLATFTAQRRQKEIGIRKVVGASIANITTMLSKDFLQLVLVALLIAFPISWWAMHNWLQGFAYRTDMGAGVFIVAGLSVISVTVITISYQAIKAALANPVKSLRSE